ncbi:breast cancer type 2 susceptibility [Favolaschia claudopus]|uniref:Breast cancer type 2 susceptibility n=1 Tax=Favolaschia claudopus TaxID=2862362 RepID=A0AAW0BIP1_9AGAR
MRRFDASPSTSPARKRQRLLLSSPTYDAQFCDLSQEDLAACDELEARLSQSSSAVHDQSSQNPLLQYSKLHDDPENPFADNNDSSKPENSSVVKFAGFGSAAALRPSKDIPNYATGFSSVSKGFALAASLHTHSDTTEHIETAPHPSATGFAGFGSAALMLQDKDELKRDFQRSPSPEAPPEPDYDAWFAPASDVAQVAFQTAASVISTDPQSAPIGFMKASNKGFIAPSTAALVDAKKKLERWSEDMGETPDSGPVTTKSHLGSENLFKSASEFNIPHSRGASPERPALRTLDNAIYNTPATPSPASFSRPSSSVAFSSSAIGSVNGKALTKPRPFKSPLLPASARNASVAKSGFAHASSPLNPGARPPPSFASASSQHPLVAPSFTPQTPLRPGPSSASFVTPMRLGMPSSVGSRLSKNRPAFQTPFKAGMKPGEPGRVLLEAREKAKAAESSLAMSVPGKQGNDRPAGNMNRAGKQFFDLTKPASRQTLLSSGLMPQQYTSERLENFGIVVSELKQMTPMLALYYSFHTPSTTDPSNAPPSPPKQLGSPAVLDELLSRGCHLATKPWIDNHWALILWKLAGMVCLDPSSETDPRTKRWCWDEVMRQMLYRYERELNGGARPPLRRIATQDSPAASPMVLCVSNISWGEPGMTEDGLPLPPHPELEVTDGWYRLRAQVDIPLARAVRRGVIRVGRKIGVVGAKLHSERKEASEVLEAYNSTNLVLSGNSSHLVPWHTKLGFHSEPWIATMHSLTGDGGVVAALDFVILKTYPIAFLEFREDENGEKQREGPRNEREETETQEKWTRRREVHENTLREELSKKEMRFQGYAERMEQRAGPQFVPTEDGEPTDELEELYDELEDPAAAGAVLSRVRGNTAGWFARFILDRLEKERERASEEIDQELKRVCPPREVRNFRVLVVQDACTSRRGATRSAQLTVWDVLGLGESLDVGKRFVTTNLMPTSQSAWMGCCESGSEIYLSTRRDTRWKRL